MGKGQTPPIVFRKVHIIDQRSIFHQKICDVYVEEGIIKQIHISDDTRQISSNNEWYEAGAYLSPGWIDMQVHLQDPGYEWKESLSQLAEAAISGGFVGILAYPNTSPVIDNGQIVQALKKRAEDLPIDLFIAGSITEGGKGGELAEINDMHRSGAIAFTDGLNAIHRSDVFLRALQYISTINGLVLHYPTDPHLTHKGQMNEGAISVSLGVKGIPETAEIIGVQREINLLSYVNSKIHFQPMSSAKAINVLYDVKESFDQLTIGTNAFLLCLEDQSLRTFDTNLKTLPPIRSSHQLAKLKKALKEGKIDVISSGHFAQGIEEKKVPFQLAEPGMLGLQTIFPLINEELISKNYLSLDKMIELLSINPRKILGLPANIIQKGEKASFTLFNPTLSWNLSDHIIPSRSKNSPFKEKNLIGHVFGIYHNGLFLSKGNTQIDFV